MTALTNDEVDQLAGVVPKSQETVKSTALLTPEQKSEMLDPKEPWWAKQSAQVAILAGLVIIPGWTLYSLFSNNGGDEPKVAKATLSENEKLLKQQLQDEQDARHASDKDAAFVKQDALTTVPVKLKGAGKPGKPKAPPAQYVSHAPVVSQSYYPPAPRRVYQDASNVIPVRRTFSAPAPYELPRVQPSSSFIASASSIPREDPEQAWKRLSELGSYDVSGSTSVASAPSSYTPTAYTPTAYTPAVNNQSSSSYIEGDYTPTPDTQPMGGAGSPDSSSIGVSIPAGTQAKAELTTPVLWASDMSITDDEFLVKLTQPLGTALPKGTLVVMKPDKVSNAGLVRFKAIRATVDGTDKALPDGIEVVSSDGGYIKASQKKPGSGINFADVFGVLLGGASTATQYINQPSTSSIISSTGGLSQTVTNSQPDILAAFGQGAANSLLNRAQSRVQQVQSTRSPYFLINNGTELKLLVTQTLSI